MSRSVCRPEKKHRVTAIKAIGADHAHLGPVGEEGVILEDREAKGLRDLKTSIQHNFPGEGVMALLCIKTLRHYDQ